MKMMKYKNSDWSGLPEVLEVFLNVREQRVLHGLNMLPVYFLWDQLHPPAVFKKHTHTQTICIKYKYLPKHFILEHPG